MSRIPHIQLSSFLRKAGCTMLLCIPMLLTVSRATAQEPATVLPEWIDRPLPDSPQEWVTGDRVVEVKLVLQHTEAGRVIAVKDVQSTAPWPSGVREALESALLARVVAARGTPDCRLVAGERVLQLRYAPKWKRPIVVEPARKAIPDRRWITNQEQVGEQMFRVIGDAGITSLARNVQMTAWVTLKAGGEVTDADINDVRLDPSARTVSDLNLIKRALRVGLQSARFSPALEGAGLDSRVCFRLNTSLNVRWRSEAMPSDALAED